MSNTRHDIQRNGYQRRLTHEDALRIWQAHDAYRVQTVFYALIGCPLVLEWLGYLTLGRWVQGTIIVGLQVGVLWGLIRLLRLARAGLWWCVDRAMLALRCWWQGLVLVLALSGALQGCADSYKTLATIYGCDPAAVEQGYCTMPKKATK